MKSISQFKKENFIANSDSTIRKAAQLLKLEYIAKETVSFRYVSLEDTMIEIGAYCRIETDEALKPQKLYMLKVYKFGAPINIVKIGISSNVSKRVDTLNEHWKNTGYSFKLYRVSATSSYNMVDVEKSIHTILRFHNKQADLGHKIDGYTEMFRYNQWMDHLVFSSEDYT